MAASKTVSLMDISTQPSDLKTTNEVIMKLLDFMFNGNSIMTCIHIVIFAFGLLLLYWLSEVEKKSKTGHLPPECTNFASEMLNGVRDSTSTFVSTFGMSAILFGVGVWFESKGTGGMMVQVTTYFPAVILAITQITSIYRSANRIKQHIGA